MVLSEKEKKKHIFALSKQNYIINLYSDISEPSQYSYV